MKLFNKPSMAELVAFATSDRAKRNHTERVETFATRMQELPTSTVVADSQQVGLQMAVEYASKMMHVIK